MEIATFRRGVAFGETVIIDRDKAEDRISAKVCELLGDDSAANCVTSTELGPVGFTINAVPEMGSKALGINVGRRSYLLDTSRRSDYLVRSIDTPMDSIKIVCRLGNTEVAALDAMLFAARRAE